LEIRKTRGLGGYRVTLAYPIPLLPSGPGGIFRLQLHGPPKPVLSGVPLKRREWDSNPRWSYPHTRFPSVLLKPLGHLSEQLFDSNTCLNFFDLNCLGLHVVEDAMEIGDEFAIINLAESIRILLQFG
jgi:hypothetical protein